MLCKCNQQETLLFPKVTIYFFLLRQECDYSSLLGLLILFNVLRTVPHSLSCLSVLHTRLKMVCLCWLFVVVMAYVCVPGFGSKCWESSICNDLSSKGRILVGQTAGSIIFILALQCFLFVTATPIGKANVFLTKISLKVVKSPSNRTQTTQKR